MKIESVNRKEVDQANLYVLNNTIEVIPYISQHPRMSEKETLNEHNKIFLPWFKKRFT